MHRIKGAQLQQLPQNHPLQGLISNRLSDLSDLETDELEAMIEVLILEPSDVLTQVDAELGYLLSSRPVELIETHEEWLEVTYVMSDDGAGVVMYVPASMSEAFMNFTNCNLKEPP
jgi:hypothetical protein